MVELVMKLMNSDNMREVIEKVAEQRMRGMERELGRMLK